MPQPVPGTPVPASRTIATKFETAEDYRQYIIEKVKAAGGPEAQRAVDETTEAFKIAWNKYLTAPQGLSDQEVKSLRRAASYAEDAMNAAKKAAKLSVEAQRALLNEVDNMVGTIKLNATKQVAKKYQPVADDILGWMPKEREVASFMDRNRFTDLVVKKIRSQKGTLGQYWEHNSTIDMMKDSTQTFVHEFGHHVSYKLKGFMRAQNKFFNERTIGEKVQKLLSYDVPGKKDNWKTFSEYAGRVYEDGRTTEVASVGIEHIWKNPIRAATKDPDWFNLIISELKGIPISKTAGRLGGRI